MTRRRVSITSEPLILNGSIVSLEEVLAVAEGRRRVTLSTAPDFRERIARGNAFLERLLEEEGVIYGVTTGYGDSCTREVSASDLEQLPRQLYTFHGCGLGEALSEEAARAVIMVRLVRYAAAFRGSVLSSSNA